MIFCILFMVSCTTDKDKKAALKFGEIVEYYPAFGKDHKATVLEKRLQFDFNEYAIQENSFVDLEFVDKDGKAVPNVKYFINGEAFSKGNAHRFRAKNYANQRAVKIGVQFLNGIEEDHYKGYLRVSQSDLDRVDNTDLASGERNPVLYRWTAKYKYRMHPILVGTLIGLAAILTILLLWFLIFKRLFFPKFKGGELEFLEPDIGSIRLKGYRKMHLGNKVPVKQGGLSKLFTGKIKQELRDLDFDITLEPQKKRGTVWTRYKAESSLDMDPTNRGTFYNFEEYKFKGPDGRKYHFVYKNSKHKRRY